MTLVEQARQLPATEREDYLAKACANDTVLFELARRYVQSETDLGGFLLEPQLPPIRDEGPFEAGTQLGRFRIVREVARGGMGIVYEAEDEKLKRRIALKCAKPRFQSLLSPEVRHASEISHPNVCKIFEIHTAPTPTGTVDFITMEFLSGETLSERLRSGLTKPDVRLIAQQLCAGLAEAHKHGVVHGDLKSNNVILTTDASQKLRAVITDFGLARRPETSDPAVPGVYGGTPGYMAPELWKGHKPSATSDVYALGVILRELVWQQRPHEAETLSDDPPKSIRVPTRKSLRKWDRVISRCLNPDPTKRFHDATEVAAALAPSDSRRLIMVMAAAVLVTVASSIWTYESTRPPEELVRLAILPFSTDATTKALSDGLLLDAGKRLSHLKKGRAKLTVVPLNDALQYRVDQPAQARNMLGATHALSGELRKQNDRFIVTLYLTDTHSMVRLGEWRANYSEQGLDTMPIALAGMVTGTLALPPIATEVTVNGAAYPSFAAGTSLARVRSSIDAAIPLLERAVQADPRSPLTHASLADAYFTKYIVSGENVWSDRAVASLQDARQLNPDVPAVLFVSGRINDNNGHYEQAEADYKRAIELGASDGETWSLLALAYEHENRSRDALASYLKAIELQPGYFRNYQTVGQFYSRQGDYEKAAMYYIKMVELAEGLPEAHYQLATPYLNMGRFDDADRELTRALALKETFLVVQGLGLLRLLQGKDAEAIPYLKRALEIGDKDSVLYLNLGTALRRAGLTKESLEAYRAGFNAADARLAINPRDASERAYLAYLCARLGDRQRAESEMAQALQLSEGANNIRFMAAQTYEALGLREKTMAVIADAPLSLLQQLNRWPDLADLRSSSRFQQLLKEHQVH
jgi:serine/threonine protein kinase